MVSEKLAISVRYSEDSIAAAFRYLIKRIIVSVTYVPLIS